MRFLRSRRVHATVVHWFNFSPNEVFKMPFVCVLSLVLLFIAALGSCWWWRTPAPQPWYGGAAFLWGIFFLALYLTWSTLKALGM